MLSGVGFRHAPGVNRPQQRTPTVLPVSRGDSNVSVRVASHLFSARDTAAAKAAAAGCGL
jgi:hypothetical protein